MLLIDRIVLTFPRIFSKLSPLSNNFWKCNLWGTIYELFYILEKTRFVLRTFKFSYFKPFNQFRKSISKQPTVHNLWIVNQLKGKLGLLIDIIMGNIFRKYFAWFWDLGSKLRPSQFTSLLHTPKTNYDELVDFCSFEGAYWDDQKSETSSSKN